MARQQNGGESDDAYSDYRGHPGAEMVSTVFKVVAIVVLIGGIVGSVVSAIELHHHTVNEGTTVGVLIGGIVGSIIGAATVAFFAYVLDLLMSIDLNTDLAVMWVEDNP